MDGKFRPGLRRPRHPYRWLAVGATGVIGSAALFTSVVASSAGAATGSPTIVISGDSVLATSLPSFGQAMVSVTRPDAITGAPVVIGVFSRLGDPLTPFSVNTTTPTPLNPNGDCWQQGALSEALTPDLQPGDTVTVSQGGLLGSGSTSASAVVTPGDLSKAILGPISGCSSVAPWARNEITSAPRTVANGAALTVSGVAQPLATEVSVSASDGNRTSDPVSVTPAADSTWTASIPAAKLAPLANTDLSVTPVMAVPDAGTGAPAHIAGMGARVSKSAPPPAKGKPTKRKPSSGKPTKRKPSSGKPTKHKSTRRGR
jgi:hypothetical protein